MRINFEWKPETNDKDEIVKAYINSSNPPTTGSWVVLNFKTGSRRVKIEKLAEKVTYSYTNYEEEVYVVLK